MFSCEILILSAAPSVCSRLLEALICGSLIHPACGVPSRGSRKKGWVAGKGGQPERRGGGGRWRGGVGTVEGSGGG